MTQKGYRRMVALVLCLSLLGGCAAEEAATETSVFTFWTTNEVYAREYDTLAELWNQQHPDRPLRLDISIYSQGQIDSKLSELLGQGPAFESTAVPDMVDLAYSYFPNYVYPQTTVLYPLQNLVEEQGAGTAPEIYGDYTDKDLCYALPYPMNHVVLCATTETAAAWAQCGSFEKLAAAGPPQGEGALQVDYYGYETFLTLFLKAGQGQTNAATAYDETVALLRQMKENGATQALLSGTAYNHEALSRAIEKGETTAFLSTLANLSIFLQAYPQHAGKMAVLPLPSYQGDSSPAIMPATATAITLNCKKPFLLSDFLGFVRYSQAATGHPLLYLGVDTDTVAREALLDGLVLAPDTPVRVNGQGLLFASGQASVPGMLDRYAEDVFRQQAPESASLASEDI